MQHLAFPEQALMKASYTRAFHDFLKILIFSDKLNISHRIRYINLNKLLKIILQNVNIQFGEFQGIVEYQNLKEIVDDKLNDINVTYRDTTKPNEIYYREKAIKQVSMFAEFKYYIINEMIQLIKNA